MACKPCLQNKPLRNSHIFPELLYKSEELYDDNHRFLRISSDPAALNVLEQKGRREHLLCWDCEQLLDKRYEKYAKRALYTKRHIYSTQLPHGELLSNINYASFKLFLLSILWRASVSTLPEFTDVNLGPHEEKIRKMLLDFDAGEPYEYGFLVLDPDSEPDPITGLQIEHSGMLQPETIQAADYSNVLFMFGGLLWICIISDQLQSFPEKDRFLSPEGKLIIAKDVDGVAKEMLRKAVAEARMIQEQRRKPT